MKQQYKKRLLTAAETGEEYDQESDQESGERAFERDSAAGRY